MSYIAERRLEEKERRRAEIVDAAEAAGREVGLDALTMDDVARRARLSRALLYVYFQDRSDLMFGLAERAMGQLHARFVEAADSPWFVQIGEPTARVLSGLGYQVNRLGVDTRLELPAHDFSGKRNETVRYSERWLLKKGFSFGEGAVYLDEVQRLSQNWRADRIVKRWEMAFLNRPFADHLGIDMRRFVLYSPEGELVALLDFDPLFRDGKVIGYTTSFKRKHIDASPHAEIGLTKFAVDRFRGEGISVVTLGLSPMLDVGANGFAESSFWRNAFERAYESPWVNRSKFNLKGQAAFKRRFHGVEEPTYIAFRKGTLVEMLGLLRLIKAI